MTQFCFTPPSWIGHKKPKMSIPKHQSCFLDCNSISENKCWKLRCQQPKSKKKRQTKTKQKLFKFNFQKIENSLLKNDLVDQVNDVLDRELFRERISMKDAFQARIKVMNMIFEFLPFVKKTKHSFAQSRICSIVKENTAKLKKSNDEFLELYVHSLENLGTDCSIIPHMEKLHQMYETLMIPSMCMLATQHANIQIEGVCKSLESFCNPQNINS